MHPTWHKILLHLLPCLLVLPLQVEAQKLITYDAGLGRRDKNNPDVWILCHEVKAEHEGMELYADSALLDNKVNSFTAYGNIEIMLSDTTIIYGSELYYDGQTRIADIWDDTVIFIDGATILYTDHLTFDRNANKAYYDSWGHTTNGKDTLDSYVGIYDATRKEVSVYDDVVLRDSASRLVTDTLLYRVNDDATDFRGPTYIYSDTTTLYSERGSYYTQQRYALSTEASFVKTGNRRLLCDTLHYYENQEYGRAIGNVSLFDSVNNVSCYGRYGETDQKSLSSYVTDSAVVVYVQELQAGTSQVYDTIWMHADTIRVNNNADQKIETIEAHHKVKVYRSDVQAMCDSAYYYLPDSIMYLHRNPTMWQHLQQCSADTIILHTGNGGVKQAELNGNCFVIEKVDPEKYNQIKGNNAKVYFEDNEPTYADILGNAEMVYYITEEAGPLKEQQLIGVNVGVGSDMRLYFTHRQPTRVVTYRQPDMYTYPVAQLPEEKKRLEGFVWKEEQRPHTPEEIFEKQ